MLAMFWILEGLWPSPGQRPTQGVVQLCITAAYITATICREMTCWAEDLLSECFFNILGQRNKLK